MVEVIKFNLGFVAINYLVFILFIILSNRKNIQNKFIKSAVISNIIYNFILFFFLGNKNILNIIICLLISYIYFHFINMLVTSRRIKIMETISLRKEIDFNELKIIFKQQDMINIRIERLKELKQINEINDTYYMTNKTLLIISKILYKISKLFNVEWLEVKNLTKKN